MSEITGGESLKTPIFREEVMPGRAKQNEGLLLFDNMPKVCKEIMTWLRCKGRLN